MQINEADIAELTALHSAYLADEEGKTTNAIQLQDDAYALGFKRCHNDAVRLLAVILRTHASALPKSTRAEIEAVIA